MSEPIRVLVNRWQCPFCRRTRSAKAAAVAHVARCWLNPAVRSCKTCAHLSPASSGPACFPGRPCDCNESPENCAAGVPLTPETTPVTGCPLWRDEELAVTRASRYVDALVGKLRPALLKPAGPFDAVNVYEPGGDGEQ